MPEKIIGNRNAIYQKYFDQIRDMLYSFSSQSYGNYLAEDISSTDKKMLQSINQYCDRISSLPDYCLKPIDDFLNDRPIQDVTFVDINGVKEDFQTKIEQSYNACDLLSKTQMFTGLLNSLGDPTNVKNKEANYDFLHTFYAENSLIESNEAPKPHKFDRKKFEKELISNNKKLEQLTKDCFDTDVLRTGMVPGTKEFIKNTQKSKAYTAKITEIIKKDAQLVNKAFLNGDISVNFLTNRNNQYTSSNFDFLPGQTPLETEFSSSVLIRNGGELFGSKVNTIPPEDMVRYKARMEKEILAKRSQVPDKVLNYFIKVETDPKKKELYEKHKEFQDKDKARLEDLDTKLKARKAKIEAEIKAKEEKAELKRQEKIQKQEAKENKKCLNIAKKIDKASIEYDKYSMRKESLTAKEAKQFAKAKENMRKLIAEQDKLLTGYEKKLEADLASGKINQFHYETRLGQLNTTDFSVKAEFVPEKQQLAARFRQQPLQKNTVEKTPISLTKENKVVNKEPLVAKKDSLTKEKDPLQK